MEKTRVLLCCGAGMSSGFLAQRMRGEAKKRQLNIQIDARSESQVGLYKNSIDILLVGPHFASQLDDFERMGKEYGFKVAIIPQDIYGSLDAVGMLDIVIEMSK